MSLHLPEQREPDSPVWAALAYYGCALVILVLALLAAWLAP